MHACVLRLRFNGITGLALQWVNGKPNVMRVTVNSVQIMSTVVPVVDSVRDLGVVLDSRLTMSAQVSSVCRSAFNSFVNSEQSSVP